MRSFLIIAVVVLLAACAAPTSMQQKQGETLEVALDTPGVPKERIFDVTKSWFTNTLSAEKKVIESENRDAATLVGSASMPFPCSGGGCIGKHDWFIPFTMRADIKDGHLNVVFTQVRLTWPELSYRPGYDGPIEPYAKWDQIKARLQELAAELQQAVTGARAGTLPMLTAS